jgi:hypothetical protein
MVEFGVTPTQILKNDAEKRLLVKNLGKKPILYDYNIQKGKAVELFSNVDKELPIIESELFVEGNPYRIFSSWKKNDEQKSDKILFLYEDKVKINFFQKSKQINRINTEKSTPKKEDNEKEHEEKKEEKENKQDKEKEQNSEKESETNEIEINEIKINNNISKFDKNLICPKYRMDLDHSPSIVYDKGNYLMMGGYWNGQIIINSLEDDEKKAKNHNQKYFNILYTNKMSPVTVMKMDESETFLICANKIGCIFIFVNRENKIEWNLYKTIRDNEKEITSLDLNENLNVLVTCDREGYINIYTFPQCKLFNSFKINDIQLPMNNNQNDTNNSSIESRPESNMNISTSQTELYADIVIISHLPLPTLIFYIHLKKCLCVYSINFHLITYKSGFDIVPNGIKKYSDYFQKDYLFIYNKRDNIIEIYDTINLNLILRSCKFEYNFIDFCFNKEMENALIMVRTAEDDNKKDKNIKKSYKILILATPGKGDNKDY